MFQVIISNRTSGTVIHMSFNTSFQARAYIARKTEKNARNYRVETWTLRGRVAGQ